MSSNEMIEQWGKFSRAALGSLKELTAINVKLGERRIDAVRRYLAVEKGVPVYKIHEISFGSEKPVAENTTKDGREKNRAVTMTIMVPKSEGAVASRND